MIPPPPFAGTKENSEVVCVSVCKWMVVGDSHFVGRSSFRLPRFLCGCGGERLLSSLSFSESWSSQPSRKPFSGEGLRLRLKFRVSFWLWLWVLEPSSARQEGASLGIPFSTSFLSCLGKQASDVLSLCPPTSPLWTSAMEDRPTPG